MMLLSWYFQFETNVSLSIALEKTILSERVQFGGSVYTQKIMKCLLNDNINDG